MATGMERQVTGARETGIRVYAILMHAPSSKGAIDFLEFSVLLTRIGDQSAEELDP
jgi:hypothetical protein